ncbi:ribonuclease P protein component [Patescibacteria group bacterium]|nr:ribonuclease P protein component [Patescibacteria group bacterium]MBU1931878.1 ribonuclease P protein component [Patescibacteria group bacterium]
MLPKQYRLPGYCFPEVKAQGKIFHGQFFSLLVLARTEAAPPRFGQIISKKVHKLAVKRNQVKRRLREAIRPFLKQLKPGFDGLILVKQAAIDVSVAELEKEIEKTFQKTGLIK